MESSEKQDDNYLWHESPRFSGISEDQSSIKSDELTSVRVKLMCSYGGRILPRPHDSQLRYIGGETRIVAVERSISLQELMQKMMKLVGKPVNLKYQLPGEDLDALISVKSDEDLDNMMDEYDQLLRRDSSSRLRVFLFPDNNNSPILSELFVDALNGIAIPQVTRKVRPSQEFWQCRASSSTEVKLSDKMENEILHKPQSPMDGTNAPRHRYVLEQQTQKHIPDIRNIPSENIYGAIDIRHRYIVMEPHQQQQRSASRSPTRGPIPEDTSRTRAVMSPSRFRDGIDARGVAVNIPNEMRHFVENPTCGHCHGGDMDRR